ncbi:MAG: site-2 protease family protein [Dehalococcoidia bacterium]|nr:site-2 protease family protein [Dehalococcoidia bacterium]
MGEKGVTFGRICGITLRLSPSWFVIFALVTWALARGWFPNSYPEWSLSAGIITGVITSLLFFVSVLAHELMHSLVALRKGLKVRAITLFIFGGVSEIAEEPKEPGDEFYIAIAGPLTSLALGGLLFGMWFALRDAVGAAGYVAAVSYWLGLINLSLGLFNLIPGFPLDGGRVLRSILWGRSGNLRSATRMASIAGRVVSYIFVFIGVYYLFTGSWLNGIWLAMIGWFLHNAAVGSYRQMQLNDLLSGRRAGEIMTRDCVAVAPHTTADQIINDYALTKGQQCFPVMNGEKLEGMVTFDSLRGVHREERREKTAAQIMTPRERLGSVAASDDLVKVLSVMTEYNMPQVPVIEDDKIVGLVSREQMLAFLDMQAKLGG